MFRKNENNFVITFGEDKMLYQIVSSKKYQDIISLNVSETFSDNIKFAPDYRYSYKLRFRGEVSVPYGNRTETTYPKYFRKLDDSLSLTNGQYTLEFNDGNLCYERSCYYMLKDELEIDKEYTFSITAKATGIKDNFKVSAEVYYGEKFTRYYYQTPDEKYCLDIVDSGDYKTYNCKIKFTAPVAFIMIKISAIDFTGSASIYCPKLFLGDKNFIKDFEYAPEDLTNQLWVGEGFSHTERPTFTVKFNGTEIFSGRKYDKLSRWSGVEFNIPDGLVKDENQFEIQYLPDNKIGYSISEVQLLILPKELEIIGAQKYQNKDKRFGILCRLALNKKLTVSTDNNLDFLGQINIDENYAVLEFLPKEIGQDVKILVSDGINERSTTVIINEKKDDNVITGTGDFIYVNHNLEDFVEYMSWYLNECIGDMITFRSAYRWGYTSEFDKSFWEKAVKIVKGLGLYYALMTDGRELNGINANPTIEVLDSEYFLGEQTHERDGAYTYQFQNVNHNGDLYCQVLSRKMERTGILSRCSPVYDKKGNARRYYAGDEDLPTVKDAYEKFLFNMKRTAAEGATRHTGVTPMFSTFFKVGYKWLGFESMYGSHEILFGALRGMSSSVGQNSYGAHLALQWSTVPCDDREHAMRYKLSLYQSYLQGASQINTEEGLWYIENPFEGFDRFSYACTIHTKEQREFNRFIKAHERKGKQVRKIAMMVGKYDGMECFSAGKVYGLDGKFWKYSTPEYSWDLLKVFYPQAKIEAIYHFVKKGGEEGLREKDKKFLEAWPELYGGKAIDCQSLGFYSETPYGVIDLIDADSENLDDYEFIFLTGWNTCSEDQLIKFCKYLKNGGKLMLAKLHLSDCIDREIALTGKAKEIDSPYLKELLDYKKQGNLIYFENDGYPIEFKEEYAKQLKYAGERYGSKIITASDRVSFTEYLQDNGSTYIYAMNICWWNDICASIKLNLSGREHLIKIGDNNIKLLGVTPNRSKAIFVEGIDVDISTVENDFAILKGFGQAKITIYNNNGSSSKTINFNGIKRIDL